LAKSLQSLALRVLRLWFVVVVEVVLRVHVGSLRYEVSPCYWVVVRSRTRVSGVPRAARYKVVVLLSESKRAAARGQKEFSLGCKYRLLLKLGVARVWLRDCSSCCLSVVPVL